MSSGIDTSRESSEGSGGVDGARQARGAASPTHRSPLATRHSPLPGARQAALITRHSPLATRHFLGRGLTALIVLGALGLWQAASRAFGAAWLLPSPGAVVAAFADPDTQSLIANNVGPTVEEALAGFALCIVVGVALAAVMASSRAVRDGLYPLLIASQAIPTIAIAAVLIVALGYGLMPKVVAVVLFSFFAITVNVYDALQTLDPELPGLLRTLGASRWDVLRTARLPAALPGFFTGARLAVAYSVSAAVYAELMGASGGLGYALQKSANALDQAQVFAIVVVMAALGLTGYAAVALIERVCVPWARRG